MTKIVEVAAAVILQPDGRFLLGLRPEGTFYAGFWEFPGGKVEAGESAREALVRELHEELGIEADLAFPWITREFVYPHAHVRLHFFRVVRWHGSIHDIQHAALAWQRVDAIDVAPLLPANAPVLKALTFPDFYAITHAGEIGIETQMERLEHALRGGLRLVQIREPNLPVEKREAFAREATRLAHRHGARVLISSDIALAAHAGADGVHLPCAQLMHLEARPELPLVAASCHNAPELARAAELGLDFVVLGPVSETLTHPGVRGLGWERFAHLVENYPLPVFALGGMKRPDMEAAWRLGAHGLAAIRAAWE